MTISNNSGEKFLNLRLEDNAREIKWSGDVGQGKFPEWVVGVVGETKPCSERIGSFGVERIQHTRQC